jgi:uncharacterized protein (DUF1800 family)
MAIDRDPKAALVALNRFGLGARGGASGDFNAASNDPRGFVKADLERPGAALLEVPGLQSSEDLGRAMFAYQADVRQARAEMEAQKASDAAKAAASPAPQSPAMASTDSAAQPAPKPQPAMQNVVQKTYRDEALARFQRATLSDVGLAERLVMFWSNHFCVSASKGEPDRIWAGAFEREAIRPHVLGRFSDLVLAVEQHPAMLFFLDNQQSIGPNSRAGKNRNRGLNENLAREILELHIQGVGSGYTQADVTSFARIITGWTFVGAQGQLGAPGTFAFNANAHEPGPQTLLGKTYPDTGVQQGEAALADIVRGPSVPNFIATKLVRHFVADDPPPSLVKKVADVFRSSDGDLKATTLALVNADESWNAPLTKMRTPYEFMIATSRMMARVPEDPNLILGALNLLGQPLWTPAGPNGFPDTAAAWSSPEGIKLRLDTSSQFAARLSDSIDPMQWLDSVAGAAASNETREAIGRAESRQQAVALLLMSPEFQRR